MFSIATNSAPLKKSSLAVIQRLWWGPYGCSYTYGLWNTDWKQHRYYSYWHYACGIVFDCDGKGSKARSVNAAELGFMMGFNTLRLTATIWFRGARWSNNKPIGGYQCWWPVLLSPSLIFEFYSLSNGLRWLKPGLIVMIASTCRSYQNSAFSSRQSVSNTHEKNFTGRNPT